MVQWRQVRRAVERRQKAWQGNWLNPIVVYSKEIKLSSGNLMLNEWTMFQGIFSFSNGRVKEGTWQFDLKHGSFTYTDEHNKMCIQVYKEGKLVSTTLKPDVGHSYANFKQFVASSQHWFSIFGTGLFMDCFVCAWRAARERARERERMVRHKPRNSRRRVSEMVIIELPQRARVPTLLSGEEIIFPHNKFHKQKKNSRPWKKEHPRQSSYDLSQKLLQRNCTTCAVKCR